MSKNRERKERFAALAGDIKNPRVVAAIDAALGEMIEDFLDLRSLRESAARRHKITSPPPIFPAQAVDSGAPSLILKNPRQPPPTRPMQNLNLVAGSAADICWRIIEPREFGITHAEMRAEFLKAIENHPSLREKALHPAIQRIKNVGHVRLEKARLWATHRFEKFQADVTAGRVEDIPEPPVIVGRWTGAVLGLLREDGMWISSALIAERLSSLPAFKENKSIYPQVCTALRNLEYRHKLVEKQGHGRGAKWRAKPVNDDVAEDVDLTLELEGATPH